MQSYLDNYYSKASSGRKIQLKKIIIRKKKSEKILPLLTNSPRQNQQTIQEEETSRNDNSVNIDVHRYFRVLHFSPILVREKSKRQLINCELGRSSPKIRTVQIKLPQLKHNDSRNQDFSEQSIVQQEQAERSPINEFSIQNQKGIIKQFLDKKISNKISLKVLEQAKQIQLEHQQEIFFTRLLNDQFLGSIIHKFDCQKMHEGHKPIMAITYGHSLNFTVENIKKIHENLRISEFVFDRFKWLYFKHSVQIKVPVQTTFKLIGQINLYKECILKRQSYLEQIGGILGVTIIARIMYKKIYNDPQLYQIFNGYDKDKQVLSFVRIIQRVLMQTEGTLYKDEIIRTKHAKFNITYHHFGMFKFYLYKTMRQLGTSPLIIVRLLKQLDGFKPVITNRFSLYQKIEQSITFLKFIDNFVIECQGEDNLIDLFNSMGIDRFIQHSRCMFYFILHGHMNFLNHREIVNGHSQYHFFNKKNFQNIKWIAITQIQKLNPDKDLLEDFVENWEILEDKVFQNQKAQDLARHKYLIIILTLKIGCQIKKQYVLKKFYADYNINIYQDVYRTLKFIINDERCFMRTDLKVIHQKLQIPWEIYHELVSIVKQTILGFDEKLIWIVNAYNQYEDFIVKKQ